MKKAAFKFFALLLTLCLVACTVPSVPTGADALTVDITEINGSKAVSGSYIWTTGTFNAQYWVAIKASKASYNVYNVTAIYPIGVKEVIVSGTDILVVVHQDHAQFENATKIKEGDVLSLYDINLDAGTTQNGYIRVSSSYGLTPSQGSAISVDYSAKRISGVGAGSTVDALKSHITELSAGITVKKPNGTAVSGTDRIGNGYTVKTASSDTYTIIVAGDVDGDGQVGTSDYIATSGYIKSVTSLDANAEKAADTNGDGTVSSTDYVTMGTYLKGASSAIPKPLAIIAKTEPGVIEVPAKTLNYKSKTFKLSETAGTHNGTTLSNGKLTLASGNTSGTFTTNTINVGSFKIMVGSWNAVTNGGKVSLSVSYELTNGAWSGYYSWGTWSSTSGVSGCADSSTSYGYMETDTLFVSSSYTTTGNIKARITITKYNGGVPVVENFSVTTPQMAAQQTPGTRPSYYLNNVPMRSQLHPDNGSIGNIICSPTTTAMALEYLGTNMTSLAAAKKQYDNNWRAYGNWSFAAAHAGEYGYVAYIDLYTPEMMKYALSQGVVLGCATSLTDAGHIVLVVGYDDSKGVFIVNDPNVSNYSNPPRTEYTYSYFNARWLRSGTNWGSSTHGLVYVFQGVPDLNQR
ncbi:MAG: C39 family peptidase [Clostridia bacterium]|nr:C39 family peptidase [Clostridia bacterium]